MPSPSLVFVYGTLLRGEVNHGLLGDSALLGAHRTEPRFSLFRLGAYPGLVGGGRTAVHGEVYRIDGAMLARLDRLEDYPRLYDRCLLRTRYGRAWVYLYRGSLDGRPAIPSGNWRDLSCQTDRLRARAVRDARDAKNPTPRLRLREAGAKRGA